VPHAGEDLAQRAIPPRRCSTTFPLPIAGDPQEPRREGAERLIEGLGRRGQRVVAVAAPVASGRFHVHRRGLGSGGRSARPSHHRVEECEHVVRLGFEYVAWLIR